MRTECQHLQKPPLNRRTVWLLVLQSIWFTYIYIHQGVDYVSKKQNELARLFHFKEHAVLHCILTFSLERLNRCAIRNASDQKCVRILNSNCIIGIRMACRINTNPSGLLTEFIRIKIDSNMSGTIRIIGDIRRTLCLPLCCHLLGCDLVLIIAILTSLTLLHSPQGPSFSLSEAAAQLPLLPQCSSLKSTPP